MKLDLPQNSFTPLSNEEQHFIDTGNNPGAWVVRKRVWESTKSILKDKNAIYTTGHKIVSLKEKYASLNNPKDGHKNYHSEDDFNIKSMPAVGKTMKVF